MTIKDKLENRAGEIKICNFQKVLNSLNEDDLKAVLKAIEDGVPKYYIAQVLVSEGHKIGKEAIVAHISKACKCK